MNLRKIGDCLILGIIYFIEIVFVNFCKLFDNIIEFVVVEIVILLIDNLVI